MIRGRSLSPGLWAPGLDRLSGRTTSTGAPAALGLWPLSWPGQQLFRWTKAPPPRPPHPALQKQKVGAQQSVGWRPVGGLPPVRMVSHRPAVGGRPSRKSQCVLQAEMWLSWVCSCLASGPRTGRCPSSDSDVSTRLPPPHSLLPHAGRASAFLVGCSCFSAHPPPSSLLVLPSVGPVASSSCFLLGPKCGDWSSFVRSSTAAQVDKGTLPERRTSQEENLK